MRPHRWIIPVAALLAAIALAAAGPSCGKDFSFHLQSWLDAATQLRHGIYPRWNFLSAYNAGEPRYVFYPPVSWLLGALFTLLFPFPAVPTLLTWTALTLAGFSFYRLASRWVSPSAAIVAACVYLTNPFFLFSIAARAAYGEIFAAAILPLLLDALLSAQPTILSLALPLAFIALSNIPAAVIAAYLFLLLALVRLIWTATRLRLILPLLLTYSAAGLLALALDAFFLLPALHQRPFIHADEPFIFPLRPTDSLFFSRTLHTGIDDFLIRIAHLALFMALATALLLAANWYADWYTARRFTLKGAQRNPRGIIATAAAILAAITCFMLTQPSEPLWRNLPGLYILQFPWRLLMLLAVCMALALAVALRGAQFPLWIATTLSLLAAAALSTAGARIYCQPCAASETPQAVRTELLVRHHSPEPIDEYVIANADQELMRPDNPPIWLANDPLAYAPGTTPNDTKTAAEALMPAVPDNARLAATPLDFTIHPGRDAFAILNLQAYPNWRLVYNNHPVEPGPPRPDGLLTLPVDAGTAHIALHWHHGWDEYTGTALSLIAVFTTLLLAHRQRLPA